MPIGVCSIHQLPEVVICCEGECLKRYCLECFTNHNLQHKTGVTLNESSKLSLIEWNSFLLQKFKQIQENIKTKGISAIFEMRLNPSYPKGLINELNNNEVAQVSMKIIQDYLGTLTTNIQFISTRQSLDELDIPELMKDIFVFFVYQASKGLNFLAERVQIQLRQTFKDKKIYEFVNFSFAPKQLRVLQIKRKSIIKNVQNMCLVQLRKQQKQQSPIKVSTPTKFSQKSPSLVNSGIRNYGEIGLNNNNNNLTVKQHKIETSQSRIISPRSIQNLESTVTVVQHNSRVIQTVNKDIDRQVIEVKFQKQPYFGSEKTTQSPNLQPISNPSLSSPIQKQAIISPTRQELTLKTQQNTRLIKQNDELNMKVRKLQQKLQTKQRSIRELNKLIGNEEEQLHYRENQVQLLTEQIKKLMVFKQKSENLTKQLQKAQKQLKFKQKSINELNNLICNEEEEIQFRENQVETLTIEIKKLVEWKQRCEDIEKKLSQKQKQLDQRQKGIKQLNNVIGNQEQELAYRQSQVEMLTAQLKKASDSKIQFEDAINKLNQENNALNIKVSQLEQALKVKQKQVVNVSHKTEEQNFDEQLMEEVIELESQVVARNQDIKKLVVVISKYQKQVPSMNNQVKQTLKSLTTVKIQ